MGSETVLKLVSSNFLWVAVATAIGCGVGHALGVDAGIHEMLLAAGIMMLASVAAAIPLGLSRRADQMVVTQLALGATVIHLMVAGALAAWVLFSLHTRPAFTYWMMAFYWLTLIGTCRVAIRAVRNAPLAATDVKNSVKVSA